MATLELSGIVLLIVNADDFRYIKSQSSIAIATEGIKLRNRLILNPLRFQIHCIVSRETLHFLIPLKYFFRSVNVNKARKNLIGSVCALRQVHGYVV